MKTAIEMYNYCLENAFGAGMTENWGIKHFKIIEDTLQADEDVLMAFIGLHNYISMTKHDGNCAYVVTNKRIIVGQKKLIGEYVKLISLDLINDITYKSGLAFGAVTIDTMKEVFNVGLNKQHANNIFQKMQDILIMNRGHLKSHANQAKSVVDELRELKQLMDEGVLTSEEFEIQKAKVLNN